MRSQHLRWSWRASMLLGALMLAAHGVAARQDPALPEASTIVARSIAAAGGEAAFKSIKSTRKVGRFELTAQNTTGTVEVLNARPNKAIVRIELKGLGKAEYGFDGTVAWEIDPTSGPSLVTGRRLTEVSDDSVFDSVLHSSDYVKSMTTVAKTDFDKRPAYQVHVVFKSGNEEMEYFDAETFLEIGSEAKRELPMGVLPTTTVVRDYKKFGQLLQPVTTVARTMGLEQVFYYTTIEYNSVPGSAFDLPAPIKTLVKNKK